MTSDQKKITPAQDGKKTPSGYAHKVLIVDDEAHVGKALGRILERMGLNHTYVSSGEKGLEILENEAAQFSLILSDQRMPGLLGTDFLSRAREISPETIRYLITGYSEMETILNAVNKGAVQHYISKPWDYDTMQQDIEDGLAMFEKHLESEKLLNLAKKQNSKLYELNCELVETAKTHENQKKELDQEIENLSRDLDRIRDTTDPEPSQVIAGITDWIKARDENPEEHLTTLQNQVLTSMYDLFTDLALKNGIEMPKPAPGDNNG